MLHHKLLKLDSIFCNKVTVCIKQSKPVLNHTVPHQSAFDTPRFRLMGSAHRHDTIRAQGWLTFAGCLDTYVLMQSESLDRLFTFKWESYLAGYICQLPCPPFTSSLHNIMQMTTRLAKARMQGGRGG